MANDKVYPNYLMHYRTKGSKNGYSKSKYYTPVGQKAKGRWVNGKYVYDATTKGAKNDWQQSGNWQSQYSRSVQGIKTGQIGARAYQSTPSWGVVTEGRNAYGTDNSYKNALAKNDAKKISSEGSKNAWQQQANYQKEKDRKRNDAIAKGKANNWQSKSAKASALGRLTQDMSTGKVNAAKGNNGDIVTSKNLGYRDDSYSNALKRKEHAANQAHSDYLMKNTKSAMGNDPRYGGLITLKDPGPNVNEKNTPYFNQSKRATNIQELAAARAKNKQALNDFAESYKRNKRSDIGNAIADAKEDAKKKWKDIKKSAKKTASKIGKKGKSLVEKFKNLFK